MRARVSDAAATSPAWQPGTIERAYQLARSGQFARLDDIRARLMFEGHEAVRAHLDSPLLRRDLNRLCKADG